MENAVQDEREILLPVLVKVLEENTTGWRVFNLQVSLGNTEMHSS
jgi:hypothetical protein